MFSIIWFAACFMAVIAFILALMPSLFALRLSLVSTAISCLLFIITLLFRGLFL